MRSLLQETPGVDTGSEFRIHGYRVRLEDGVAAGTCFWQFRFLEGPWAGLAPWFQDDEAGTITYEENVGSDGFGFNWRLPVPERIDSPIEGDLLPLPSGAELEFTTV